ncbi:MAG: hypothetical protein ACTSRG_17040 [Candidatus Helarchaeota archaeon]
MGKKTLFQGTIEGIVTSVYYIEGCSEFSIKTLEKIEGIPEEFHISSIKTIFLRKGDKVQVHGRIYLNDVKFWKKEEIWMDSDHIYNETLGCGL